MISHRGCIRVVECEFAINEVRSTFKDLFTRVRCSSWVPRKSDFSFTASTRYKICLCLQMMVWWFTTFMAPAIKQKVISISGIEYLYSIISQKELEIPAFITEYDMTVS